MKRLLRLRDVKEITGLGKSTIYDMMNKDKFPRPVRIAQKAVAWKSEDIDAWINGLSYVDAEWMPNAKQLTMMNILNNFGWVKDGKLVQESPDFTNIRDNADFDKRCDDWFKHININGISLDDD